MPWRRLFIALGFSAMAAAAAWAQDADPADDEEAEPREVEYEVDLQVQASSGGVDEDEVDDITDLLSQISTVIELEDDAPPTVLALRARADEDVEDMQVALRSRGYYDSDIEIAIDEDTVDEDGDPLPVQVTIRVELGPLYTMAGFAVDNAHPYGAPFPVGVDKQELEVADGMPARAANIVDAEDEILEDLGENGHPFPQMVDRAVIVDHATRTVNVTFTIDPGPIADFGTYRITGLTDVEQRFVERMVQWEQGEQYDEDVLAETRSALAQAGVFASVVIEPDSDWVSEDGQVPLVIDVAERPHRTIGGALEYASQDGPGVDIYWQHRNIFGQAEDLETRLTISQRVQSLGAEYRDDYLVEDGVLALTAEAALLAETQENYSQLELGARTDLQWAIDNNWAATFGLRFAEQSLEEDGEEAITFSDVGVPFSISYDLRDNPLNPTEGTYTKLELEPVIGFGETSFNYLKVQARQTGYYAPLDDDAIVLAGWFRLGSLLGATLDDIPADQRLYAGGANSVRAFAYQHAGDFDDEGDPVGGTSLAGIGAEARFRFLEDYGAVLFMEGARTFDSQFPTFDEPLFWGGGIGARYYTGLGPLRVDVAVPFNRRNGVDDSFQFYVSFGQAF